MSATQRTHDNPTARAVHYLPLKLGWNSTTRPLLSAPEQKGTPPWAGGKASGAESRPSSTRLAREVLAPFCGNRLVI